jgi:hypothetical protein
VRAQLGTPAYPPCRADRLEEDSRVRLTRQVSGYWMVERFAAAVRCPSSTKTQPLADGSCRRGESGVDLVANSINVVNNCIIGFYDLYSYNISFVGGIVTWPYKSLCKKVAASQIVFARRRVSALRTSNKVPTATHCDHIIMFKILYPQWRWRILHIAAWP